MSFLHRKIAERQQEEVEKYLVGLRQLLDQYTLPTAGKILGFVSQATIRAADANGMLRWPRFYSTNGYAA